MKGPQLVLTILTSIVLGMFAQTVAYGETASPTISENIVQIAAEAEGIPTEDVTVIIREQKPDFELTDEEMALLARIVHAEAGNQDQVGKRLVVDVILNRVEDEAFPNTVGGVIYQSGQFTAPAGYYTESDMQAVIEECERRIDKEILWFRTGTYHNIGVPAYQHGAHYFSKRG